MMKITSLRELLFRVHLFSCMFWGLVGLMWTALFVVQIMTTYPTYTNVVLVLIGAYISHVFANLTAKILYYRSQTHTDILESETQSEYYL